MSFVKFTDVDGRTIDLRSAMAQIIDERRMGLSYDKEADVLYISFGTPREAISEEADDGILLRRDPISGEVVGITIVSFEKRFGTADAPPILPVILDRVRAA